MPVDKSDKPENIRELDDLPGADLVLRGLKELEGAELGECGLLVLAASPRLRSLGINVPERPEVPLPYEHQLYAFLEITHRDGAYSRYNSLMRRIVSFENALAHIRSRELRSQSNLNENGA